ncbi:MAG: aminotransferase class IV [Bacteroidia bacterium]|nr:aminotransferase class IV [Bacteroidia bacterium]
MNNLAYYNGTYMPKSEVKISPDDRGFLFGDGVYEVIICYHGLPFYFEEHLKRLEYSLKEARINFYRSHEILDIISVLLRMNGLDNSDSTAYIQITRGVCERKHHFPDNTVTPTVYITVNPFYLNPSYITDGIKTATIQDVRWNRCDIKSVNLLANVLAQQEAFDKGANEGIFVKNGIITEGTHTSVFGIRKGVVFTHPAGNQILPSITRLIIFDLCIKLNIPIFEIPIKIEEISTFDELFLAGTTREITPVVQLDEYIIGKGTPGPITQILYNAFQNLVNEKKLLFI